MAQNVDRQITEYIIGGTWEKDADRYVAALGRIKQAMSGVPTNFKLAMSGGYHGAAGGSSPDILGGLSGGAKDATSALDSAIPILKEVGSLLKALALAGGAAAAAILGFGYYASRSAAEFESLRLGLQAYAGTAAETQRQLERLKAIARVPGLSYRDVIEGSTRLQAAGFDARLAERALLGVGNALALVGKGKADVEGVVLALTQIASKGSISAEEINQIAERIPQIREVMIKAFGTADTQLLQKMGVKPREFIEKVLDALETLPRATGGWQNSLDNLSDTFDRLVVQAGSAINVWLMPALDKVSGWLERLEKSNAIGNFIAKISKFGKGNPITDFLSGMAGKTMGALPGFSLNFSFLADAKDAGDLIVRAAFLAVNWFKQIPGIFADALAMVGELTRIQREFVESIFARIKQILEFISRIKIRGPWGVKVGGVDAGDVPNLTNPAKYVTDPINEFVKKMNERAGAAALGASDMNYEAWKAAQEGGGAKDPGGGKGGWRTQEAISRATERTAKATERIQQDLARTALGGGTLGQQLLSPANLSRVLGSSTGRGSKLDRAVALIKEAVAEEIGSSLVSTRALAPA